VIVKINNQVLKKISKFFEEEIESGDKDTDFFSEFDYIASSYDRWSDSTKDIDLSKLSMEFIVKYIEPEADDKLNKRLKRYFKVIQDSQSMVIKNLKEFPAILKSWMEKSKSKILYTMDSRNDALNPYVVIDCKYVSRYQGHPAHCTISMSYINIGKTRSNSISLYREQLNKTMEEILMGKGYSLENSDLNREYDAQLDVFKRYYNDIGKQLIVDGYGTIKEDSWWDSKYTKLNKGDYICKVVVDDFEELEDRRSRDKLSTSVHSSYFGYNLRVPYHLNMRLFDLNKHLFYEVHVDNVKAYEYDSTVLSKLVLDNKIKKLISTLVNSKDDIMEDIIKGKASGLIIISTGAPGVGKTLTAECYSEIIKRPIYKVQCSQLGLDVEELEKNLQKVLNRAVKWNALLLIDEADVYIRKRREDIHQNAVVGTFLRVLEYYSGVLFMTSNMGSDIDDAIMSRATAHIQYEIPNKEDRVKIADIMIRQFKIEVKEVFEIHKFFEETEVSGRDIKSILKLASKLSEGSVTRVDLEYASNYIYTYTK